MRIMSRRSGFSLVELLTVIAIIAILAAVIFPVMGTVRERARQNQCITNLKQIAMSVVAFKGDNRQYPRVLSTVAVPDRLMEQAKSSDYLFGEYINTIKIFHCPSAKVNNSRDVAQYLEKPYDAPGPQNALVTTYAYDSYACYLKTFSPKPGTPPSYDPTMTMPRYATSWVKSDGMPNGVEWLGSAGAPPADGTFATAEAVEAAAQEDYARQLKFRNPPGDTVVTWCSNHEGTGPGTAMTPRGMALVLFLDGHVDVMPANKVETCLWRVRPSKG